MAMSAGEPFEESGGPRIAERPDWCVLDGVVEADAFCAMKRYINGIGVVAIGKSVPETFCLLSRGMRQRLGIRSLGLEVSGCALLPRERGSAGPFGGVLRERAGFV